MSQSAAPRSAAESAPESTQFNWEPQPGAQALVGELVDNFLDHCVHARNLADRMRSDTGTRFGDWIDHLQVPRTEDLRVRLADVGFERRPVPGAPDRYIHPGAIFPAVVLDNAKVSRIGLKVDSVVDFLSAHKITDENQIEGEPMSPLRRALVVREGNAELWAIERHGYEGFAMPRLDEAHAMLALRHLEAFRRRMRDWAEDDLGFDHVLHLIDAAVEDLGDDEACDLFFQAEREYWHRRNRAAQVQKARQDRLGLGWANHDHHTYRSSRRHFTRLIEVFERLGFHCRERFYAGAEAGWGAQVLEHSVTGIVIFADVDLTPDEIMGDFAHEPLPNREELGTVGLWCALHGDSILQAGMHHLECVFDHESLKSQLEGANIHTMDPFSDFPHLKQAFTEGERWPIPEARLERLLADGVISSAQAHWFRMQGGAIGSHLENLERNDGYKGFNQQGVSNIIARTDPRNQGPGAENEKDLLGA